MSLEDDKWGALIRKSDNMIYFLTYKNKPSNDCRYTMGRDRQCDIVIEDSRVSSRHCAISLDFSEGRARVILQDTSSNGTFVNGMLDRMPKGSTYVLKSGETFSARSPTVCDLACTFVFFNLREFYLSQRAGSNPDVDRSLSKSIPIEIDYIIKDSIGNGTCGVVHLCINRMSGAQRAVKIINTRRQTSQLSGPNHRMNSTDLTDLRNEALLMKSLDHVSN